MAARKAPSDPLASYNAKRDFAKTAEPAGKRGASDKGNLFIVQKHAARRLHWDFRLEVDGVLKSWAVTRGPSADPDDKRLAVRTEDQPLAYGGFEGRIPKGEYGGGTVMLWDRGIWEPIEGKSAKDLDEGHLHFRLYGQRMQGEWLLVRMKGRPGEKRENWLLRKVADGHDAAGDELVEKGLTSVLTGRTMAEIEADKAGTQSLAGKHGADFAKSMAEAARHTENKARSRAQPSTKPTRAAPLPKFRKLQLATLVDAVPAGNLWMHEIKFDGYRALFAVSGGGVAVYTRSGLDWTDKFGPLAKAMGALDLPPCLIDGEIIARGQHGNPDFSALQAVLKRGHGAQGESDALEFHAFDLLELDGEDLAPRTQIERKERLEALLADAQSPIFVADHLIGGGEKLYQAMCEAGQEGVIAKRIDAPYLGRRTRGWVKVKCSRRQEFVVVGWSRSRAKGRPFSSLLLGQYEGKHLVYRGKVGTGFDGALLDDIAARLARLERKSPALEVDKADARGASWVTPKLVAEVAFAELTAEGRVRHASFVGLRSDKTAPEVTEEKARPMPKAKPAIAITNRDRVIFPESGRTKGQLADYYVDIAPLMLPFAAGRPVSLVRCPQGRAKACFFQKHDSGAFGPHVHHVPIREKDGGTEDYLYIDDADGLLTCVQMGTIEFHGWGARADAVEKPDRMVFDLDPDEGLDFADCRKAAQEIRRQLADLGLVSFAMLSGGKGVHVVVPLDPDHGWDAHKDFSQRFAQAMSQAHPDRYVATMSKAKRKGRIFIDWLRNQRGSTAVLPYSARARAGAPVAVPIDWDELGDMKDAHPFSIDDAQKLLERAKILRGWGFAAQKLPEF
ncbi:bifunctional non-homologous end joining protein LigD [Novosphingobium sp. PhB165]|uniref:DNA ligase D n=1 Tax=Novosphingobium sp. PhB165 TaxID=2485105 RepID=UPI00104BE142|nr:DNA ligase D [Novosphingobium sp. PhB165]TCM21670.1 bifunctional non-homologous end joining protein LigD [Novosphingobium sp. PhB165]